MTSLTQTITLVLGIIIWFSFYLFMEVKVEKLARLKQKPIIRSLVLFSYMYIGITILRTFL